MRRDERQGSNSPFRRFHRSQIYMINMYILFFGNRSQTRITGILSFSGNVLSLSLDLIEIVLLY